jgi:hypothetical protein
VHHALPKTLICGFNSITFAARYLVVMEFALNRQQPTKADFFRGPGGCVGVDGRWKLLPGESLEELFCDSRRHCPFCHENFGGNASNNVLFA